MRHDVHIEITLNLGVNASVIELAKLLKGGMSDADVQALAEQLKAHEAKLKGIAKP